MKLRHAAICVATACFAAPPASAAPVKTSAAACALVKSFVKKARHAAPSTIGFCDTIPSSDSPAGFYIIALHSNRRCEGICSTNMGWYAVEKNSGRLFGWDLAEQRVGPLLIRENP